MFSATNNISRILGRLITVLLTIFMSTTALYGNVHTKEPEAPQSFTPVVRFAVCSDVHLDGSPTQEAAIRLGRLFDDSYAYAQSDAGYQKLDAVIVAGDFANTGADKEYEVFNSVIKAHIKPETQLLAVLGNHEFISYRDYDATIGYEKYKQYVYSEVDRHDVINGYHFIGVSYDDNGKTFSGKVKWLRAELDKAKSADPTKPIFVYQHPHPLMTVYGSVSWSDKDIRTVLSEYPQVVDFSGHSHYASSDPRSVWQGNFTAVGTGSLSAYMSNLDYISGDEDAPGKSGGFWIVEADAKGVVHMKLYDIENRTFFDNVEYWFTDVADKTKRGYTWYQQSKRDTKPAFPADAQVTAKKNDVGRTLLQFPDATGYYEAESYAVVVGNGEYDKVFSGKFVSDYVRAGLTGVTLDIGEIPPGEYEVEIIPYSPYMKQGNALRGNITVD